MELDKSISNVVERWDGVELLTITAGKTLKIKTSPQGSKVLEVTVPDGKKWVGAIRVQFVEFNE